MKNQVEAPNKSKRWSESEDQEIINCDYDKYTDKHLAKLLGRSLDSISKRRQLLRDAGFEITGHWKTRITRDYFTL